MVKEWGLMGERTKDVSSGDTSTDFVLFSPRCTPFALSTRCGLFSHSPFVLVPLLYDAHVAMYPINPLSELWHLSSTLTSFLYSFVLSLLRLFNLALVISRCARVVRGFHHRPSSLMRRQDEPPSWATKKN